MTNMDDSPLNAATVSRTASACIGNGDRLLADAKCLNELERFPSAVVLAMLAQEEYAKAFVLVLVRDGCLPWTRELRRAAQNHECKHLIGVMIEWLGPPIETALARCNASTAPGSVSIPHDVAVAMNILRHEKLELFSCRWPDADPYDTGRARKIARGLRDREKQRALYVNISLSGEVTSEPQVKSATDAIREIALAESYAEFVRDAEGDGVLSHAEYAWFKDATRLMFTGAFQVAEER